MSDGADSGQNGRGAVAGKKITHSKPHQRVQSGVAYVPQGREIFPRLTVEENLLLGLSRFSAREAKNVPEEIWQLFPVLKEMKHRRGAIFPVGNSSSWLLAVRWRAARSCLSWMNQPKAFSHR
jgi:urea transport system ATP-binding protein